MRRFTRSERAHTRFSSQCVAVWSTAGVLYGGPRRRWSLHGSVPRKRLRLTLAGILYSFVAHTDLSFYLLRLLLRLGSVLAPWRVRG